MVDRTDTHDHRPQEGIYNARARTYRVLDEKKLKVRHTCGIDVIGDPEVRNRSRGKSSKRWATGPPGAGRGSQNTGLSEKGGGASLIGSVMTR